METVSIEAYSVRDFAQVVALLRDSLIADPVTESLFARRVLLDPNFDPEGAAVARVGDAVVGFLLAIARRWPLEDGPDDSDRGYITLFAVAPQWRRRGIGGRLLAHALHYLRGAARTTALVSPYAPNYWTPGVDVAAYPEALAFLEKQGFETISRPLSMDVSLAGPWRVPVWVAERGTSLREQGVQIEAFDTHWIPEIAAFLRREFAGDWQRHLRETMNEITLGRRQPDDLLIALEGETVVGFSQHEGERFGPVGVAQGQRGRGIGAVLLFRTLETMRRSGSHNAWFLWTDERTADRLYRAAGFRETRRYAVMRRALGAVRLRQ